MDQSSIALRPSRIATAGFPTTGTSDLRTPLPHHPAAHSSASSLGCCPAFYVSTSKAFSRLGTLALGLASLFVGMDHSAAQNLQLHNNLIHLLLVYKAYKI